MGILTDGGQPWRNTSAYLRRAVAKGQNIYAITAPVERLLEGKFRVPGTNAPGFIFDADEMLASLGSDNTTLQNDRGLIGTIGQKRSIAMPHIDLTTCRSGKYSMTCLHLFGELRTSTAVGHHPCGARHLDHEWIDVPITQSEHPVAQRNLQ